MPFTVQLGIEGRCDRHPPLLPPRIGRSPPTNPFPAPPLCSVCSQRVFTGRRARLKPRILPAATGAGLIAYSALNAGVLGGPIAAGVVGAGVGCVYLGVPSTKLVDEGPLILGAVTGGVMGMAFSKVVSAGAATREGKVMTVVGLASLGAFGLSVKDMAGPTAYTK